MRTIQQGERHYGGLVRGEFQVLTTRHRKQEPKSLIRERLSTILKRWFARPAHVVVYRTEEGGISWKSSLEHSHDKVEIGLPHRHLYFYRGSKDLSREMINTFVFFDQQLLYIFCSNLQNVIFTLLSTFLIYQSGLRTCYFTSLLSCTSIHLM